MNFSEALKIENDNTSYAFTENGGVGYSTTGSKLIDMNFKLSSYRNMSENDIINDFSTLYNENSTIAIKWLFYARDVRGGAGERRFFRVCLTWLAKTHESDAKALIPIISEYGRFDDIFVLLDTPVAKDVVKYIVQQLKDDYENYTCNKPCSLLAKWMPTINASSKNTVARARKLANLMKMAYIDYQQIVSELRKYIKVLERDMSANNWGEINYNAVPSKANVLYKDAFLKHDEARRKAYLASLASGDKTVKINSAVNFPYDIVHKYNPSWCSRLNKDDALEELWKNLPNYVTDNSNSTMVVLDTSGSMSSKLGCTKIKAEEVAASLAIYFAERARGEYNNKIVLFSSHPKYIELNKKLSLADKLSEIYKFDDCSNTNIVATFDLLLDTAVKNNMKQEDIPSSILIVSDMEFDSACTAHTETIFDYIERRWNNAGYKMPKLIFWNVCNRSGAIPVNMHKKYPVILVGGFTPAIVKMVLSNELNPYKAILDVINSERYDMVEAALNDIRD